MSEKITSSFEFELVTEDGKPISLELSCQEQAAAKVGLAVDHGKLVVEPQGRPRYTMAKLLTASDYSHPQTPEEREWVDAPALAGEIIWH